MPRADYGKEDLTAGLAIVTGLCKCQVYKVHACSQAHSAHYSCIWSVGRSVHSMAYTVHIIPTASLLQVGCILWVFTMQDIHKFDIHTAVLHL